MQIGCFLNQDFFTKMLQSDGKREDLERVFNSKLSSTELEIIFARTDCCANHQCMKNIIQSCSDSNASTTTSNNSNRIQEFGTQSYYCRQIGIQNQINRFDQYVQEVRKPFQDYIFGTDSMLEANKQLRTYLVHKFQEGRILTTSGGSKWIYQLYSITQPMISVCKTAYIAMTGLSNNIIEYAQRKVRTDNISYDASVTESANSLNSLKSAFEYFCLDDVSTFCKVFKGTMAIENCHDWISSFPS